MFLMFYVFEWNLNIIFFTYSTNSKINQKKNIKKQINKILNSNNHN